MDSLVTFPHCCQLLVMLKAPGFFWNKTCIYAGLKLILPTVLTLSRTSHTETKTATPYRNTQVKWSITQRHSRYSVCEAFLFFVWSFRGQRMWTLRNSESLDSTVFLFHKGPTPGDFPRLECNILLHFPPLCSCPVIRCLSWILSSLLFYLLSSFHILLFHFYPVTLT